MALVVFLQNDEDVLSVYRNLKIFCETTSESRYNSFPPARRRSHDRPFS